MDNDNQHEKLAELDARIRDAASASETEKKQPTAATMAIGRIGFDFMGAVLGCTFLGWLIDKNFGTKPWGLIVLIPMGFIVGMTNVWRALSRPTPDETKENGA